MRTKKPKPRNPIAKSVRRMGTKIVPDKKKSRREKTYYASRLKEASEDIRREK
jgi:hypothetical protein